LIEFPHASSKKQKKNMVSLFFTGRHKNHNLKKYIFNISNMSLISLGAAASYAVLAYSTITSTGKCMIYGDMGIYPGTAYTGFPPSKCFGDIYSGTADASAAKGKLF
jgi:hypothetical protein